MFDITKDQNIITPKTLSDIKSYNPDQTSNINLEIIFGKLWNKKIGVTPDA